jgi:uncharacterized protein YbbC (DUF1343 family)
MAFAERPAPEYKSRMKRMQLPEYQSFLCMAKKNKPTKEDLADVDIMMYDLQDVGVRFYTNINALSRLMEACHENDKQLLILDRPNPNGYLIDGPILDMKFKSGIGMFPIPAAHGLTVGEFAQMANGEGWLTNKVKCKLKVIKVANYDHDMPYTLPVSPSPNLNTQQAVLIVSFHLLV